MNDPRRIRSPTEKIRLHRTEWNQPDPYLPPGSGPVPSPGPTRKRILSRPLRSMSPPRRIISGDRRAKSIERGDDYNTRPFLNAGGGSPSYVHNSKWFDEREGFMRREDHRGHKYLLHELKNANVDVNSNEKNFHVSGSSMGRGISLQKSVFLDDGHGIDRIYRDGPIKISRNFPSSSAGNLDVIVRDEELRNVHRNKVSARGLYNEDKEVAYSREISDSIRVLSRSKMYASSGVAQDEYDTYVDSHQDSFRLQSHAFGRKPRKYVGPVGQEGYGQAPPPSGFARDPEMDFMYHQQDQLSPARDEHQEYSYVEYKRRERDSPDDYMPDEVYRKVQPSVRGDYASRDSVRPNYFVSVEGRPEYNESLRKNRESGLRNNHLFTGEPGLDYLDTKRNLVASQRDRQLLGSGSNNFVRTKVSKESEINHPEGNYEFGEDIGVLSYKERMRRSQMFECDPDICRFDISPKRRPKAEELDIYGPSEKILKRKYVIDEEVGRHNNGRSILLTNRITSRPVQELNGSDEQWTHEDPADISVSKRLRFGQLQHRKFGRPYDGTIASRLSSSDDWISSDDLPVHIQRRVAGSYTRAEGIKGRLRPCPSSYHESSMDKKSNFYKSNKYWKRNLDNQYSSIHRDGDGIPRCDGDLSEDSVTAVKPEPPEDSEEFKQLVETSFFRFSKLLNVNPAQRRRYKEQGYAGSLFCSVCGRLSKEFMDTRSLVTHTFMSRKVGIRSDHLGLHKALCVLMGWNSTVAPNGACLYQVLPEAEAIAQKEDLVLWPPLVIIHNSSINSSLDDRQVVSIEKMEAILIDMGFSGGMIKVRRGKPANQSIMVVRFLPTFSSLQEAERLHNYFIESKRGRKEFQQLSSNNFSKGNGEAGETQVEKMELVLYGYMGIAEDLDKLDFDTKKRCVVKSKKDIQAIADAPVKTE